VEDEQLRVAAPDAACLDPLVVGGVRIVDEGLED
jgi:hypothetical protein